MPRTLAEWKGHIGETFFGYAGTDVEHFFQHLDAPRDKTVVHIPARSGSTRVRDKNITELCGVPLLAYTIAVAKALPVDRVIVNTDSRRYADVAEKYGAEVPFLRPEVLNRDDVPPGLATYYAERFLLKEGYPLQAVIDMYPTSPFRNVATVSRYVGMLHKAGYCCTAFLPDFDLHGLYAGSRHLDLHGGHADDGSKLHYKIVSNFVGRKLLGSEKRWFHYELIDNPIELIDIDTPEDLRLAGFVIENGLYDFGVRV